MAPTGFIQQQAARLAAAGIDTATTEIEIILTHILKTDRLSLYLDALEQMTPEQTNQFESIMQRRLQREPLQFILGEAYFYGRIFRVTPAVMAPTPETERLCEAAIAYAGELETDQPSILDLGVGSGVISVTLACELPTAELVAVDVSTEALDIAISNAEFHGVHDRIDFRESDLFAQIRDNEQFDLILSNPPYIAEPDYGGLSPEVRADPKIAMTAGVEGMDIIRQIIDRAPNHLAKCGRIMFEMGYDQSDKVAALTSGDPRYSTLTILKDYNDIDRVTILGCDI